MTNFTQRVINNGVPSEAGIRAVKLLREYFYCKTCPIRNELNRNKGCMNCNEAPIALLTSLDAWRPLWEMMNKLKDRTLIRGYSVNLTKVLHADESNTNPPLIFNAQADDTPMPSIEIMFAHQYLLAQPHHHLEAALRTLEVECPECEIKYDHKGYITDLPTKPCICANTNGKITLYDKWEKHLKGEG